MSYAGSAGWREVGLAYSVLGGECTLGEVVINCGIDATAASVVGGVSIAVVGK